MKKINFVVSLLILAAIFLEVGNVYLSNKVATESIFVSKLQEKIAELDQKNQMVKSEILEYTSYENIASRASAIGFAESRDAISLYSPVQVAVTR